VGDSAENKFDLIRNKFHSIQLDSVVI